MGRGVLSDLSALVCCCFSASHRMSMAVQCPHISGAADLSYRHALITRCLNLWTLMHKMFSEMYIVSGICVCVQ